MPIERFAAQYYVPRAEMCEVAPLAVEELMRRFVRTASPQWETVRINIVRDNAREFWVMRLTADGIPRPGGNHG